MSDAVKTKEELDAYLQSIRKSIAEGEELVRQAELRMAETDRLLAKQGYTREQVLAMKFTEDQIAAANAEFERRGLEKISFEDDFDRSGEAWAPAVEDVGVDDGHRHRVLRRMTRLRI